VGPRLQFAHSDLSRYPVFEEAFSQGDRCAVGLKKALDWVVLGWVKRRIYGTALQRQESLASARYLAVQLNDLGCRSAAPDSCCLIAHSLAGLTEVDAKSKAVSCKVAGCLAAAKNVFAAHPKPTQPVQRGR
jgi:hypothetical protein